MTLKFRPVCHSWAAVHPQPKGVIQFIAGAFFGTFAPTFFYRYLLQSLFAQGYTIIVMPFSFTFNHYKEAGFLIKEQYEVLPELVRIANLEGYEYEIYLDDSNFLWLGHSLGCKYISLLEGFSDLPKNSTDREAFIYKFLSGISEEKQIVKVISDINFLVDDLTQTIDKIRALIFGYVHKEIKIDSVFIKGQLSILLAPDISDTASAIRPRALAKFIDRLGLGVQPTPEETFSLIQQSGLFNLLGLVRFKSDKIAETTCDWFINVLKKPSQDFLSLLPGGHLKPLGILTWGTVFNALDKPIFESVDQRNAEFEKPVEKLLLELEKL